MTKRYAISIFAALGLAISIFPAAPANAAGEASNAIIEKMNPGQIAAFMNRSGFSAKVEKDSQGDPMITANGDNGKFGILFYDCDKGGALANRFCTDMEFMSVYNVSRKPKLSKLNKWNAEQGFGKAYLRKDGKVTLAMPINLAKGVSEGFIMSSLEWWVAVMSEFDKQMWPK